MTHDILFTVNTGDHKGSRYGYTLVMQQGVKAWSVTPLFRPAPSMIKERIEMMIVARGKNIPGSGAVELRGVSEIIDELSIIADETDVTLKGLDKKERPILIDKDGFSLTSTANEQGRSPEYRITLTCWGLYSVD